MGSGNEALAAPSSCCLAAREGTHGEALAVTGAARLR